MTENRENWLYPDASGLYFPHDGFIMRATDGKQYDYEEECGLLNEYDKKYNEYRKDVLRLEEELDYYKTKCSSLEEGLFQQDRKIAKLEKENNELNSIKCFADNNGINIFNIDEAFLKCWNDNEKLVIENKELQERNNRQAKQLDDIYRLIEQKDWRALSDIMDDFKKAEEQLQKEWGTYGDSE